MHMNTMYACKNAGRAGSTPVVGTTLTEKIGKVATSAYFPHKNPVSFPHIIEYRGLSAKVYGKTHSYRYYRATW